jgi:hypothetical protein
MNDVVITTIGLSKIAGATVEEPLILERFAVGDGGGSEITSSQDMTSLVNEKYRDLINSKYSNNNNIVVECVLRGNALIAEGFYLRELGIFDVDEDLIAIVKLPESYRPPLEEGQIVTENIFNITLRVENTENIQIMLEETVFATTDALQRLLERVEILENTNTALMKSKVGIDTWFNTNNTNKGEKLLTIGIQTWGLMEEGNFVSIEEFQDAFKNSKAVDRGDGTFQVPIMHDGTIRNIKSANTRELGSFEADDLKAHEHGMAHDHDMWHDHDMSHQHGEKGFIGYNNGDGVGISFDGGSNRGSQTDRTTWGGRDRTGGSRDRTSGASKSVTDNTGGAETRMKNTAGQWYMLLKINI